MVTHPEDDNAYLKEFNIIIMVNKNGKMIIYKTKLDTSSLKILMKKYKK